MYKDDEAEFLNILAQNHVGVWDNPFIAGINILFTVLGTVELRQVERMYVSAPISKLLAHNISESHMRKLHSYGWFAWEEVEDSGIYYIAFEKEEY